MQKHWISTISSALMIVMLMLAALPVLPVQAAARTASVTGNWNNPVTWGGSPVPGASDDVSINSGVTVTVPAGYSAACLSINFTTGTTGLASISLADNTSSLTVGGAVTIQQQAGGGNDNQIDIGAGTFSAASLALSATTDASRSSQILISSGTATVSGNISSSGTASRITFSAAGRFNAGGTFMSGTAGTFTPSAGTVHFNGAGAQTVGAYTFRNLMLSGGSAKTLPAGTSVTGNLSITGSVKASVAAGQNLSVGTLALGGVGTANGTWGSSSSPATHQTNTYFDLTTGYLTVTTDTRTPQATLMVSGPESVTYGTPGTITTSGGSGGGEMSYSQAASTGCTVNATSGVITVTNASLSCTVTATKAADKNYLAATSAEFEVTLNKAAQAALSVTGPSSVTYGTTGTITTSGGSGTGALSYSQGASTGCTVNVSTGVITVTNASLTCTVTATKAADNNYLVTSSVGFGIILNKAAQVALAVTGPASVTYGTTGTITYTGGSGTGVMSYSQAASTGCTVNASTGVITVTNASGSCTVMATKAADNNYLVTSSVGFGIILNKAAQAALTVTGPSSVTYGTTGTITTSGGSGTGALSYGQAASTGCTVNATSGVITLTNASLTCTVTATKAADNNYLVTSSVGFGVTLNKAAGSVSINNMPGSAVYGGSFTPTFTKLGDGTALLASLTPGTCTVTAGVVNFVGPGSCTLQAFITEGSNYLAATGTPQSFLVMQGYRIYLPLVFR